ncbi:hypothetical protein ACFP3T_09150 [Lactiplantibacillus dongliensis]|uniref:Extracellular protein n=1 Tax=Lactiplantibacillus dongliensis TaxID=2559919 RepID=A0ABW1R9H1_9LACO|nr:hypothetical protein [Lactiplantibacillus dongliensis]
MKHIKKVVLAMAAITALAVTVPLAPTASAQASTTTTPKTLRGTWYTYAGSHRYNVTKITAHTVTRYDLSARGKVSAKQSYTNHKSGRYRLHVTKHRNRYGGTVYSLNKGQADYQKLPLMWVSHRRIHGTRYRVLKSYTNGGYFNVATKHKLTHSGSYQYMGSNPLHQIGK